MYSLRAQADRKMHHIEMKHTLEEQKNLFVKQAEIITKIVSKEGCIEAVETIIWSNI